MSGIRADLKGMLILCLLHLLLLLLLLSFHFHFVLSVRHLVFHNRTHQILVLGILKFRIRIDRRKKKRNRAKQRHRQRKMEMKRDIRVEKKEEEDNMCTSLLTAVVVLSMACLKHFSSVPYLIEQWRSLVFLLLNVVLLAVYFTSTHPSSGETHDFKTRREGRLRMMRGKKDKIKKKKTMMVEEPTFSYQDFLVVEPKEVIKKCVLVEETKRVCPEIEETMKDCLFHKKEVDFNGEEDDIEPGRLSNEELNERVEAFITTFRQHLVLDARRGRVRKTDEKMRSKDSEISFLGREVTCSV